MSTPEFEVRNLSKFFGSFRALGDVSFTLKSGETLGLVGPNGSGKTTLVNTVCGLYAPTKGEIFLRGELINGQKPHRLAKAGINRTFQIPKPFRSMTVKENVQLALSNVDNGQGDLDEVLFKTGLTHLINADAGSLTAAQQKRLDLARAISLRPRVLFIDELGAGLNPSELHEIADMLRSLAKEGKALVVVEHLMGFLETIVDQVLVLSAGMEIFRGQLRNALADLEVKRVFLGDAVGA